jgi:hypothetical protein
MTVLLPNDLYYRLSRRAKLRGATVSAEIRDSLERVLDQEEPNPNQAWLDLAEEFSKFEWKPGPQFGSEEWKEEWARDIEADSFNMDPADLG